MGLAVGAVAIFPCAAGLCSSKCHPSACWNYVGQENGQGLLVLGISDDVVEGHAGSAATHHEAAQNLRLAFSS